MIAVKKVYVGNANEAFIENRLSNGVNIIHSGDNNKGKTIVMQAIMYAMGALAAFPASFCYREYFFILDLLVDGSNVSLLRKNNVFVVLDGDEILPFESAREFCRYWSERFTPLPSIVKDGQIQQVGLELYSQMYFVSQDNRSSAKVFSGRFDKNDFLEMLYSIRGLDSRTLDEEDERNLKQRREVLKASQVRLRKQADALNTADEALAVISPTADRESSRRTIERMNAVKNEITDLMKKRNHAYGRKKKNEMVRAELNSLNREISTGRLVCLNCGSDSIGFSVAGSDVTFDITTSDVRNQILRSIAERIDAYAEEITAIESELRTKQFEFDSILTKGEITLADVVSYQDQYANVSGIDHELTAIATELDEIKQALEARKQIDGELRTARKELKDEIVSMMSNVRTRISTTNSSPYEDLFTTASNVYSGSDTTEYFIARTYAIASIFQHGCPVVIDSFRAEDLSTMRESNAIEVLSSLKEQVILTTTTKAEETGKYSSIPEINSIDYSCHETNKLLSPAYVDQFKEKALSFAISLP